MFKQYEVLQSVLSTIFVVVTVAGLGIPLFLFTLGKLKEAFSSQRTYAFDAAIEARMQRVDLGSWKDLCREAGVRRGTLDLLRQGEVERLRLKQLRRLGTGLDLSLVDLLKLVNYENFGQSKTRIAIAPGGIWGSLRDLFQLKNP
ncbi:helix-turn-helix domain-containing protein [Prochlorothrix hollandica]|uniref:HTH cro/C1-type domain-containing protein n=1 Tax=Prochlorothrix hollandica PCC 9006 = CALU 1027 TaxID=317619 RepID=A0A0M2Q0B4_PROHO|nr:helix-turn-helix domain-containing protein [Prochlorothrix hollandica]KKJ00379.1 hypothetical protein PROH_12080 [Prochlorothrix hollandica PCC 9006 = CALU 1027]